jgi:serine/threonine-protein kinase RsbW
MTFWPQLATSSGKFDLVMKTILLPGRYENLAQICDFVRQAAEDAGLESFAVYSVETAVEEACTNIIEHAYGGEGRGDIECSCQADDAGLVVRLRDTGKPFNPDSVREPDIHAPLKKRKDHGLGIFIMRKWMDDVQFEFTPGKGNILVMTKRKGKKG